MGMEINCMETIASVHKFFSASQRQNIFMQLHQHNFVNNKSSKTCSNLCHQMGHRHESVSTFSNLQFTVVEALAEISAWPDREELHYELCSCFRQLRKVNFALLS